jgi:hypothetical protein
VSPCPLSASSGLYVCTFQDVSKNLCDTSLILSEQGRVGEGEMKVWRSARTESVGYIDLAELRFALVRYMSVTE